MDLVNGRTEQEQRQAEKQEQPFIVVAAVENDASSSDPNEAFIPTKEPAQQGSSSHRPAFNLLSKDDLLREQATDFEVVEAAEDANAQVFIPTREDTPFKLLSREDLEREDDIEVVEASDEPRSFDIPTNDNGHDKAGFKLLTKEDLVRLNEDDSVVVVEVDEEVKSNHHKSDTID